MKYLALFLLAVAIASVLPGVEASASLSSPNSLMNDDPCPAETSVASTWGALCGSTVIQVQMKTPGDCVKEKLCEFRGIRGIVSSCPATIASIDLDGQTKPVSGLTILDYDDMPPIDVQCGQSAFLTMTLKDASGIGVGGITKQFECVNCEE